ncbi:hypothetical protein [Flavobacterium sp.]|uniref:hypothetical protein n=1 Tax=Flavobacterium sp. TaxID=239 RepID=UPI0039E37D35
MPEASKGVYVINKQTEHHELTQENGYFSIVAAVGDTLMFSSTLFKGKMLPLETEDFEKELLIVKLDPVMQQIADVTVMQYKNINAVDLGIIPRGQKSYTPAERKLKTANGYNAQFGLDTKVTLDPIFNMLSGRTAELRKNVEVEKKEFLLAKIEDQFEKEYFTEKLNLPEEHVKGFQFYIVENPRFVAALNEKNKTMAQFIMSEMAVQYLEILANEKK